MLSTNLDRPSRTSDSHSLVRGGPKDVCTSHCESRGPIRGRHVCRTNDTDVRNKSNRHLGRVRAATEPVVRTRVNRRRLGTSDGTTLSDVKVGGARSATGVPDALVAPRHLRTRLTPLLGRQPPLVRPSIPGSEDRPRRHLWVRRPQEVGTQ